MCALIIDVSCVVSVTRDKSAERMFAAVETHMPHRQEGSLPQLPSAIWAGWGLVWLRVEVENAERGI